MRTSGENLLSLSWFQNAALKISLLHPLSVDGYEVIQDDEGHCSYSQPIREIGEGFIGDHAVAVSSICEARRESRRLT